MSMLLLTIGSLCQLAATLISFAGFPPQWIELYRSKSSANISLRTWLCWLSSASLSMLYALILFYQTGVGLALVCSAVVSVAAAAVTVLLVLHYQRKPGSEGAALQRPTAATSGDD